MVTFMPTLQTTLAQAAPLLALGAAMALLSLTLLAKYLPRRPNHAGHLIPTSTGTMLIPIILLMFGLSSGGFSSWSLAIGGSSYLAYSLLVVVVGFLDDVWGGAGTRGFGGHIGALWRGRVTMGAVKVVVFGGGAVVFGLVAVDGVFAAGVGAVLLAGSVNLANLFDVRPGRVIKFVGVALLGLAFVAPAGAVLAVAPVVGGMIALFYFDLKGRIMLGDAGAAVFGAALGYLVVSVGPGPLWAVSLAVVLGLTAVAEVSSISKVIERVGLLRRFDKLGRG